MTSPAEQPSDGQLTVRRVPGGARDLLASYKVWVDQILIGRTRTGDESTVRLTNGSHSVRVPVNWTGSPSVSVDIKPGEQSVVEVAVKSPVDFWSDVFARDRYISIKVCEKI